MARHNLTFLYGAVIANPTVRRDASGTILYVMTQIRVVRADRSAGDKRKLMKSDAPFIMSRDDEIMKEMMEWKANDVVEVKGMIAVREMKKAFKCDKCKTKNAVPGTFTYVNPFYARKRDTFPTADDAVTYLAQNREISNQVFLFGELVTNPDTIKTKAGLTITQYQIALNRKYHIKKDPPEVRTDFVWTKSYGDNAITDSERLHVGTAIFVDGCLQTRSVLRTLPHCINCGEPAQWKDKVMEVVPYECEYMRDFYTTEEVEEMRAQKIREIQSRLVIHQSEEDIDVTDEDMGMPYVKAMAGEETEKCVENNDP